jgi:glycosyltransferase involved in cell wall biosynthesis
MNNINNLFKDEWPRISIVTPSYNQGHFIEETIRSVLLQGYPSLEYIIIDGGSTDSTIDIIRKYESQVSYWTSESDRGQTHAINKGWERSTGEILAWLNSDDQYAPGALFAVAEAYRRNPRATIAGQVINFQNTPAEPIGIIVQKNLTWKHLLKFWEKQASWHQPGIFFPRNAWQLVGPLDESFFYCMDRDFLVQLLQHTPVTYLDTVLAYFRVHDASKTGQRNLEGMLREKIRILHKYQHLLSASDCRSVCRFWGYMAYQYFKQRQLANSAYAVKQALRAGCRILHL